MGGGWKARWMCDFVHLFFFVLLPPMAVALVCPIYLIEFSGGSMKKEKPKSYGGKDIETLLHPAAEFHVAAHACFSLSQTFSN